MALNSSKTQKKGRSPYKMLLLTALIIPCVNSFFLGTLMFVTDYFGTYYGASVPGTVFTVLYEIISSLFAIIRHCALIMTFMTLGSCLFKHGVLKTLPGIGAASLMSIGEILAGILALLMTFVLGVNDSTLALSSQLIALLPILGLRILSSVVIYLLALPLYLIAKKQGTASTKEKQRENPSKKAVGSSFMLSTFVAIGIYTCYLFIDPITVVLTPASSGNFLNNYVLPLIYPVVYGGFMVLAAIKFSEKLSDYYNYRFLAPKTQREKKSKKEQT